MAAVDGVKCGEINRQSGRWLPIAHQPGAHSEREDHATCRTDRSIHGGVVWQRNWCDHVPQEASCGGGGQNVDMEIRLWRAIG